MKPNKLTTLTTLSTIALLAAPLAAQDFGQSGLNRPLTLAPADATSSSGGGAEVDDEKAKAAGCTVSLYWNPSLLRPAPQSKLG